MKVTFVHLGREHLGIEYLSSVLKKEGHQTSLAYDPGLFGPEDNVFYIPSLERVFNQKKKVIATIKNSKPDLVAFSVYTSTYRWACGIARIIKETLGVKTVFGGIHASLVPEAVIRNDVVDFVIVGEGELAMLDLAEAISSKKSEYQIPNLWYKKEGRVIKNALRPPIQDLDRLPLPDKELFERDINYRDDYVTMASRGCVFSCSYCCESYYHRIYDGKYFRRRSITSVMRELKRMKEKHHFKRVMFFDSVLFTDRKWLEGFLHEYKKEISLPFRCTGHVSFVDSELIKLMKDSGCYCIDFGVQTFNESIRSNILNRLETNDHIERAFGICDRARLRYDIDLMFGLPTMREDDYKLPIKFMDSHKYFNRLKCYYLSYYPELPIVDKAKVLGIIEGQDIERINNGVIGDWFHSDSIKDPQHKAWKDDFERFYKLYPLIPSFVRRYIVKKKLYRFFHLIPRFAVVYLQLVIGICRKDRRFYIYINNYIFHLKKVLRSIIYSESYTRRR